MLRRSGTIACVALLVLAASIAEAASLTVSDIDDAKNKPLSNHAEISCGKVVVGKCGGKTLMLANLGHRPVAIEQNIHGQWFDSPKNTASGRSGGKGKPSAAGAIETCGGPLKPGDGCTISVEFCPKASGARAGSLKILDGHKPIYELKLSGAGIASHRKK